MKESIKLVGHVKIYRGDELVIDTNNTVVTAGYNYIAGILGNQGTYAGKQIAIGTMSTAVSAGDTALGAEVGTRVDGTMTVSGNVITIDGTFGANNPTTEQTIQEAGLFTAATAGTMVARTTFGAVTKPTADSLRIVWEITIGA